MNDLIKSRIICVVAVLFFISFFIAKLFIPEPEYSETERRKLIEKPEVSVKSVLSGKYMKQFDEYAADNFPFKEDLRKVKVFSNFNIFNKNDDNGLYVNDNHISKLEYPFNEKSFNRASDIFKSIKDNYLNESNRIYMSLIPDKNAFNDKLKMNYDKYEKEFIEKNKYADYIRIADLLDINDYYYTDPHWNQIKVLNVADRISERMNRPLKYEYGIINTKCNFSGAYGRQLPVKSGKDVISYLWNNNMKNYVVKDIENDKIIPVYDTDRLNGYDPYDIFLSGPKGLMSIENKNVKNKRELVLFRDSFGSSIAPLLAENYSKITLVDIRYVSTVVLDRFVEFNNADILFLYNVTVINNSETIKF